MALGYLHFWANALMSNATAKRSSFEGEPVKPAKSASMDFGNPKGRSVRISRAAGGGQR